MSVWWTKYRAQYELENRILSWTREERPILLVGERLHADYLSAYVNDFDKLNIVGFIDTGASDAAYASIDGADWTPLNNGHAAHMIVCSWERQFAIRDVVLKRGWQGDIYLIYDNMGRSLEDLYPLPDAGV